MALDGASVMNSSIGFSSAPMKRWAGAWTFGAACRDHALPRGGRRSTPPPPITDLYVSALLMQGGPAARLFA
ncbi:hypothetical protein E4A48_03395 [Xanthomonas cerealis pv. cerealis]|uniref:Uncharacterized protein n=1 Tax=Xanthomonas cerealis pv. cerealis TaxID=152263 RepID=A0A514E9Y6_9XANT|nr:hypothetical protein [Xanthomonas translucens]QDI02868.1 hypothetical protein E4A48_03395 [Xanthomonas translucens pv. cerealis]UKE70668.1 hypothetical protein K8O61_06445 [Xanthomonas translucens pv. pistacia]